MIDAADPIRILHVDDEPGFAELAADFLEREEGSITAETATGVTEGCARLSEGDIDCIVSDYDMPGENGIEFLERVRQLDPELPFILFTGKGSEEIASDAISAGVTGYLQKESGTGQYAVLANRIRNAVEQSRAKHEVEASQRRLSLFIEQSPLGVLEYDEDFEIVRSNEKAEGILGYSESELRGHTWETLVTEDSYDDVDELTDELERGEGGYHSIDENVRKDGERIVCEWHNRIVTDDDDNTVAVFSQFQDITERRTREERLTETTARLEALFENSPDGISVHDADGTVLEVNPRLCSKTGYGASELTGMKVWDLDTEADPADAKALWAGMDVGDRHRAEGRYRRADGSTFPVEVHVRRLNMDGDDRFVAISRDISARKKREAELDAAEERRQEIHRITAATDRGPDEAIAQLLEFGTDALGMENGHVVEVDREAGRHSVRFAVGSDLVEAGAETDLSETVCHRTVETDDIVDFTATGAAHDGSIYERRNVGCYAGAKLVVDGDPFGTVCFVAREPCSEPLSASDRALVELLARCVSRVLERRASRREREAILDRMTDALFAVDREWRIEYANERGRAFVRSEAQPDADGIEGVRLWEAIPDAVDTAFHATCTEAMDEGTPASFRGYYPPDDRWVDVRAYPSDTGVSVYIRDVTEERRREAEIENRRQVLREIYDAVSNVDQSFERTVARLIDIGRRVVGTEYGSLSRIDGDDYVFEVVGGANGAVSAGDLVDLGETNCERTVRTEETVVLADIAEDAPELTDRGGYTEMGIQCYVGTPIIVEGSVYGTFCFYDTDNRTEPFSEWQVTVADLMGKWISYELHRRRTETRLREQNERLEEFASVVSHDLRNPLSVASGNLQLAREDCDSDRLDAIGDAIDRMETLIESLLLLAREGEAVSDPTRVELGDTVERHWRSVDTADAALVIATDLAVEADPSRLAQLFENLFRNSIEHGGSNVAVTVGDCEGGFYVDDDGPGIPEDDRQKVFEAGFSAGGDTGFGLAIVERVVEAHGWDVRATEGSEGGARFEFTGIQPR